MTDRHAGYVVALEQDIREDDAEAIITAIRLLKGVADVKPVVGGFDQAIADSRAKSELRNKILDLLWED